MLFAKLRVGVPAGIEQNEKRLNVVLFRNLEEGVDTLLEASGILLPRQVVQKNTHGVEPNRFRPTEFLIDTRAIKRVRLPHLQLIDFRRWRVVASNEPRVFRIPLVGGFFRPAFRMRRGFQLLLPEASRGEEAHAVPKSVPTRNPYGSCALKCRNNDR